MNGSYSTYPIFIFFLDFSPLKYRSPSVRGISPNNALKNEDLPEPILPTTA